MKHTLTFLLLIFVFFNTENAHSQEKTFQSRQIELFGKENPSEKEMKKVFRQMRRKAPNRSLRKVLKEHQEYYLELIAKDKEQADSIEQQKIKVAKLMAEVEAGKMDEVRIAALRAENDSLEAVMRMYVKQIDSLNRVNIRLETTGQNMGEYYFKLSDFVEPKYYFYYNATYPIYSQYWKISSVPDSNFLITEAYDTDFHKFEYFKEKYDSVGSKVVEYIVINQDDSIFHALGETTDVYRWKSFNEYTYSVFDTTANYENSYSKVRQFASVDTMDVLGERTEVIRFKDGYTFYSGEEEVFSRVQQSFYSKENGLVRFLRFDEVDKTNEPFILKAILTEEEWLELQR